METKNLLFLLFVLFFFFPNKHLFSQGQPFDISWEKHDVVHGSWKIFCSENTLPADEDGWIEYTLESGNVYIVGLFQEGNKVTNPSFEFSVGYNTSGIEMFGNGWIDRLNLSTVVAKANDKLRMERKNGEMIYFINGEEKFRVSAPAKELKAHLSYPFDAPTFASVKASFSNFIDNDQDGFVEEEDCNDNDATIGGKKIPGTACDDGDEFTLEDVIQEDSCMCMGIPLITLGCVSPSAARIIQYGPNLILMDWRSLPEAVTYTIQLRYKGKTNWVATQTLSKNQVFIRAPLGNYEYRLKSNCDMETSEYSDVYEFSVEGSLLSGTTQTQTDKSGIAKGRNKNQSIPQIIIPTNFSLSPNPVASELFINYPEILTTTNLVLTDNTGKKVITSYSLPINSSRSQIDVANLPKGFYFISLEEQGRTVSTKKFIKL